MYALFLFFIKMDTFLKTFSDDLLFEYSTNAWPGSATDLHYCVLNQSAFAFELKFCSDWRI